MTRWCFAAVLVVTLLGGRSVLAHHSYAGFDKDPITIEATIEMVKIENPHTLIHLRTADGQAYTVVWNALNGIRRFGFTLEGEGSLPELLKVGDRMVVTGRIKRADGWIEMLPQRLEHKVHGLIWPKDTR